MAAWRLAAVILVDSNVLIDVFSGDAEWSDWSLDQIEMGDALGGVFANQIAIAEVSQRFPSLAAFRDELEPLGIELASFGEDAAFEAGSAFLRYRQNRGKDAPRLPLPDFFIGAHALAGGYSVLTRDARFYRSYFPTVPLITPEDQI